MNSIERYLDFIVSNIIKDAHIYEEASVLWWIFVSFVFTIFILLKYAIFTSPIWIPLKLILSELNPGNKKPLIFKTNKDN